ARCQRSLRRYRTCCTAFTAWWRLTTAARVLPAHTLALLPLSCSSPAKQLPQRFQWFASVATTAESASLPADPPGGASEAWLSALGLLPTQPGPWDSTPDTNTSFGMAPGWTEAAPVGPGGGIDMGSQQQPEARVRYVSGGGGVHCGLALGLAPPAGPFARAAISLPAMVLRGRRLHRLVQAWHTWAGGRAWRQKVMRRAVSRRLQRLLRMCWSQLQGYAALSRSAACKAGRRAAVLQLQLLAGCVAGWWQAVWQKRGVRQACKRMVAMQITHLMEVCMAAWLAVARAHAAGRRRLVALAWQWDRGVCGDVFQAWLQLVGQLGQGRAAAVVLGTAKLHDVGRAALAAWRLTAQLSARHRQSVERHLHHRHQRALCRSAFTTWRLCASDQARQRGDFPLLCRVFFSWLALSQEPGPRLPSSCRTSPCSSSSSRPARRSPSQPPPRNHLSRTRRTSSPTTTWAAAAAAHPAWSPPLLHPSPPACQPPQLYSSQQQQQQQQQQHCLAPPYWQQGPNVSSQSDRVIPLPLGCGADAVLPHPDLLLPKADPQPALMAPQATEAWPLSQQQQQQQGLPAACAVPLLPRHFDSGAATVGPKGAQAGAAGAAGTLHPLASGPAVPASSKGAWVQAPPPALVLHPDAQLRPDPTASQPVTATTLAAAGLPPLPLPAATCPPAAAVTAIGGPDAATPTAPPTPLPSETSHSWLPQGPASLVAPQPLAPAPRAAQPPTHPLPQPDSSVPADGSAT
ncbi:hypothetical protein QJQ45_020337, partial [Haematococcus lacustris]